MYMHSYSYVYAVETFFTSTPNKGHNRKNSILITNQNFGPDRCHPALHFKPLKKENPYNSAKSGQRYQNVCSGEVPWYRLCSYVYA